MARVDVRGSSAKAKAAKEELTADTPPEPAETKKPAGRGAPGSATKNPPKKPAHTPKTPTTTAADEGDGGQQRDQLGDELEAVTERVHVTMGRSMLRDLKLANVDDKVDTTVRIRAMIELWANDPRLRARVDKLAAQRSNQLIRNRWTTEQTQRRAGR